MLFELGRALQDIGYSDLLRHKDLWHLHRL